MPNDVKPWVVLIIRQDKSMNVSSSHCSGGSKGRWNKMFDVHSVVGICSNYGIVNWRIHWWDVTEDKVGVAMEECCLEALRHMVQHVDRCIDAFQKHEIVFDPFAK